MSGILPMEIEYTIRQYKGPTSGYGQVLLPFDRTICIIGFIFK